MYGTKAMGLVSHLSYVPAGYEEKKALSSLTDDARKQWLAQNQREYQEFCRTEYDRESAQGSWPAYEDNRRNS